MLDTVSCLITVLILMIWIDKRQYVNNIIIVCIAIEVAKLFRINSYLVGVKVLLFNTGVDIFWSVSSNFIFPKYFNVSRFARLSTGLLQLEIPRIFETERSYLCQTMPILRDFMVPLIFITFYEKFGERIGSRMYVRFAILMYICGLICSDLASKYFSLP